MKTDRKHRKVYLSPPPHSRRREGTTEKGTAVPVAVFSFLTSLLLVQVPKAYSAGLTVSEKVLSVLNDVMNQKPGLIASEACHRLALSEGQKENEEKGGEKMELGKLPIFMPKRKVVTGAILVALMLLVLGLTPPALAESTETAFQNVTVDLAYDMITSGSFLDLVVLDVRYQYEYDVGHLYDAVLIPHDELETRIGELEERKNHEIIVYCKSGYRSQIACEILANHSFTKVYNMLGGILAWIDAGYPIYTTFHHATVNIVDGEILLQIEPLLRTGCVSCAGNQGCPSGNEPTNIQSTVLEQEEGYTVTLVTYEVDGTTFEFTVTISLLWSYDKSTPIANRTASFTLIEIANEDTSMRVYSLSYLVQHVEYNLTISTGLIPLNSETYNSSSTIVIYTPAGKSEVTSLESVEFNSSVTLSQKYAILGKVAKEMGKVYEKSGDETLAQLAGGYYTMEEEAKYLSKLVEKQLQEYNKEILNSSAILMDASWWECLICMIGCLGGAVVACSLCCAATYVCCACVGWLLTYPIDVACTMMCESLNKC